MLAWNRQKFFLGVLYVYKRGKIMRINSITSYNAAPIQSKRNISTTGIFKRLSAKNTIEGEKDRQIKDNTKVLAKQTKELPYLAMNVLRDVDYALEYGKKTQYKGRIHFSVKNNEVASFRLDEDTRELKGMNVWKDGKLVSSYDFLVLEPKKLITLYDYHDDNTVSQYSIFGRRVRYCSEKNLAKSYVKYLILDHDGGYLYAEGKVNCDGEMEDVKKEIQYNKKDLENSYYSEKIDGVYHNYTYDKKAHMWLEKSKFLTLA